MILKSICPFLYFPKPDMSLNLLFSTIESHLSPDNGKLFISIIPLRITVTFVCFIVYCNMILFHSPAFFDGLVFGGLIS